MQIINLVWFGYVSNVMFVKDTDLKSCTSWNTFWLNFVQVIACTGEYCTSHNLYFCVVQVIICTILHLDTN